MRFHAGSFAAHALGRERARGGGVTSDGFRLAHHAFLSNHLHFIVEADGACALSGGVNGLLVRIARALNALWRRCGKVFDDRYHARPLTTPREVRAALVYVLHNARRHGAALVGIDAFTSGAWFDGWAQRVPSPLRSRPGVGPNTWLLRSGWRRHGHIAVGEQPRAFTA